MANSQQTGLVHRTGAFWSKTELADRATDDHARTAELVARYGLAVNRYFARRVNSKSDAEDLTQEVFARLLKRAELGSIDNIEGYVFQVAANLLAERGRHEARRRSRGHEAQWNDWIDPGEELSPERILLGREAYAAVVAALLELPERTRVIFILNRFEDLSGTEIARKLDISVSTVEKQMMRALAHLRERVK